MSVALAAAWRALVAAACLSTCVVSSPAQDKPPAKDENEIAKLAPVDPYTGGDAALMAAVGIVGYGEFPWADGHRTEDIDRVLGERRIVWVETTHFRLGVGLKSAPWPENQAAKKALQDEIAALRKKLPKIPDKPKKIDPWLRLHLYVQRCENAYAQFQKLVGVTDADFPAKGETPPQGRYLGMPGKFLVLLCQKRSDMGRYMDRFCGRKEDTSMRFQHMKTWQLLVCVAAEGLEGFDESDLHGHVLYALWHNLLNGYNGFFFPLPHWFAEGIAHWHARKVPSQGLNVQIKDDEAVAEEKQADWPVKVRRRAQHDATCIPYEKMAAWEKWEDLGYHAHAQSWSRVDYLMQQDPEKVGLVLKQLKSVPSDGTFDGQAPRIRTLCTQLLSDVFGLEPAAFDQKWREFVLRTYPKK